MSNPLWQPVGVKDGVEGLAGRSGRAAPGKEIRLMKFKRFTKPLWLRSVGRAALTQVFGRFAGEQMFLFAAWCGIGGVNKLQVVIQSRAAQAIAVAWMVFALLIVMTWHSPYLESLIPKWMIKLIYPIDKTNLDMLRFTHFLALALLVARYFPRKAEILSSKWLRPMVLCGQHSLPLFCIGVFLSFGAHWILVQYSHSILMQWIVSFGGIACMIASAWRREQTEKVLAHPDPRKE